LTDESGFGLGVAVFFIRHSAAPRPAARLTRGHDIGRRGVSAAKDGPRILHVSDFLANYHPAGLASLSSVATVTRLSVPLRRMDASLLSRMDTTLA
jgi:hypothetical protein